MVDTGYIFSKDNLRVFINPSLGCTGGCSYCYLPKFGYNNENTNDNILSAKEIIKQYKSYSFAKETLVSIGCFCECWNQYNIKETKKLIKYFLKQGNQVQLSTKKEIKLKDFISLKKYINYYGQLVLFVSTTTISNWEKLEKNTDIPTKRFKTFKLSNKIRVPIVLYIKPVIENITIKDIDLYKELVNKYTIKDVIVGSMFSETGNGEDMHFSNQKMIFYNQISDEEIIIDELKKICDVYTRSSKVMEKYKNDKE